MLFFAMSRVVALLERCKDFEGRVGQKEDGV